MRAVFMGTPEFAVPALAAVHGVCEIAAVYTQPDRPVGRGLGVQGPPVKRKALELGLEVRQPEKLTLPGEFERLAALRPDVIVVVAYGQILKKNVLDLPPLGCVNIHSSLLPRWRGAAPIQWAILSGDAETGITTMKIAEKLDSGDILLQARTPIGPEDTASTVHDRLMDLGAELVVRTLSGLEAGSLRSFPQDESKATYASRLTKEMERLDAGSETAEALDRRIRALNPWPGTSVRAGGERLKIRQARLRRDISGAPGRIFEKAGMVLLSAREGSLELLRLQWDGKKEVDPAGFLNGLRGRGQALPLELKSGP
jgi:methionyl-tRNA formyltransferase